jgi:LuxR family transcriptional regulator, maltose regulon positive regulatory protein
MPRPRLFAALDAGVESRLTLISASPGAGKTALLSTWLAERPRGRVAWVSVRPNRGENTFWAGLLAALQRATPRADAFAHLAAPRRGTPAGFIDQLLNAVARLRTSVTLVIDDYHNVRSSGITAGIEQLLRFEMPLRLVISTRHDPALPLHVLRSSGELTELRTADLAFTAEEGRSFLEGLQVELGESTFERLLHRTEGWAAGLRLLALSPGGSEGNADGPSLDERPAAEYLANEVLDSQPDEIRRFLLQTSIVDRITPGLATALTGSESAHLLEDLVNRNLFLERIGGSPPWYRYHHLFAEILRTELRYELPDDVPELHGRAARWYVEAGEGLDAVQHAFAAADHELVVACLVDSWLDLYVEADLAVQRSILEQISQERLSGSPSLTAVAALAEFAHGEFRRGARMLEAVRGVSGLDPRVRAMLDFARLLRARLEGSLTQVTRIARRLLRTAESGYFPEQTSERLNALALGHLGVAEAFLGLSDARNDLNHSLELARAADVPQIEIAGLSGIAFLELEEGRLRNAARQAGIAVEAAERAGLEHTLNAALPYAVLALVEYQWDDLEAAREHAEALAAAARSAGDRLGRALSAYVDASLLLVAAEDEIPLGLQRLRGSLEDCERIDSQALQAALVRLHARLAAAVGDDEGARALVDGELSTEPSPPIRMAAARLELAAGDPERALGTLGDTELPGVGGVEAAALRAVAERALGREEESRASFAQALALGEAESIRRPLLDMGPPLRALLTEHLRHSASHRWFASDLLAALNGSEGRGETPAELLDPLTERELEVLHYLPTMMSNADIAGELFVSVNTVKTHVKSIYRKLDATRRREAVRRARQLQLV